MFVRIFSISFFEVICVFEFVYMYIYRSECIDYNYGNSLWNKLQKSVSFFCCCIGVLIYTLNRNNKEDNTFIQIVGNNDEEEGDHGEYDHDFHHQKTQKEKDDENGVYHVKSQLYHMDDDNQESKLENMENMENQQNE